jgi:2-dehydro-3-deoxyphosphogluconate aldolase / (4S)-4-hydroxy-2-oxoglutarate aldolase
MRVNKVTREMTKAEVQQRIGEVGIVPVIRATCTDFAVAAGKAVLEGGIPVIEVTLAAKCAVETIKELTAIMGSDVLIGGGNVLDAAEARACLDAGAQFLTSPNFDRNTIGLAKEAGILMIAGALTPTEVMNAWREGADFVNVFPCGKVGGPGYIKSLKSAMPKIPMIPSGGVNLTTAAAFLDAGAAALGVGAELVLPIAVEKHNPGPITQAARQYVSILKQRRG